MPIAAINIHGGSYCGPFPEEGIMSPSPHKATLSSERMWKPQKEVILFLALTNRSYPFSGVALTHQLSGVCVLLASWLTSAELMQKQQEA